MRRMIAAVTMCALAQAVLGLAGGLAAAQASGTNAVTTAAYGNLRDDWDANEPALSPSAIQSASFGELFATKLAGAIYAQPLVFDGTVIVTTERAYAYGINATHRGDRVDAIVRHPLQSRHDRLLGPEAVHRLDLHAGDRPDRPAPCT